MDAYEQKLFLQIALRLLKQAKRAKRRRVSSLCETLIDLQVELDLDIDIPKRDNGEDWYDLSSVKPTMIARAVMARISMLARVQAGSLQRRLRKLGTLFDLDPIEIELVGLAYRYKRSNPFTTLLDNSSGHNQTLLAWNLGRYLGRTRADITARLASDSRLRECGLIESSSNGLEISDMVAEALERDSHDGNSLATALMGPILHSDLTWSDFDHLAGERDRIISLLTAAGRGAHKAVHLLLYGPPGTGKSTLACALAAKLGIPIHAVGEADRDGDALNRGGRLAAYRIAQKLAARSGPRLLLVDEADDVLGGSPWSFMGTLIRTEGPKAHLHRLLESTVSPTIWTTNAIACVDPAILRRMTYAIEVKAPDTAVLTELWRREGARRSIALAPAQARRLAERFDVAPGLVTGALRFAQMTGGGVDDLQAGVAAIAKAMRGGQALPPAPSPPAPFSPALICADTDLTALVDRIADAERQAVSFCLYGPPGTGKTSFSSHLAERLGLRLVQKRASDLLSKWVGDTEKRIAAAFQDSRERGTLLMFDEADSLLRDRQSADRGWEIAQVNEMLTWMESHPLPFVCATNLMEGLDPAALRRFVFKIRFGWLDHDARQRAFQHYFGLDAPPALRELDHLAPGDFAVVARKAGILGATTDAGSLVALLAAEMALKPGVRNAPGFAVTR